MSEHAGRNWVAEWISQEERPSRTSFRQFGPTMYCDRAVPFVSRAKRYTSNLKERWQWVG